MRIQELLLPNLLDASTPIGRGHLENVVVKQVGDAPDSDSQKKNQLELGKDLNILDTNRGAKLAHTRFTVVKGEGARLERALINWMMDLHVDLHGYQEISPPLLVNEKSLVSSSHLPKFREDLYVTQDQLYLIPTAEVPLVSMFQDEILPEKDLPSSYVAATPCFRREAGTYGKKDKGLIRQHQFYKIELVKFVYPHDSYLHLQQLLQDAETVLEQLKLPYRVIELCSGNIGFSAAKSYDIEVWLPSQKRYIEVSSCSNCTDFQARRGNIRFKP